MVSITRVLLLLCLGIGLVECGHIGGYFQRKYFRDQYVPQEFKLHGVGSPPSECHLDDVPWISHEGPHCQTATLQMVAHKHGLDPSLAYVDFLMGASYGAVYFRDLTSLRAMPLFHTDPEPGLRVAAPYLGLERQYIVTNDADAFLQASRFYLSTGYPVRIAVNVLRLLGEEGFSPHSELLVGYDESGFYYYETGGKDRFIEGAEGLRLTDQTLLDAVRDLTDRFGLPWEFALTIFEKREREGDLSDIWRRNGSQLVGTRWGPAQGAVGIREFASDIEEAALGITDWQFIARHLAAGSGYRLANARFLRDHFAGHGRVEEAARLLAEAGGYYQEAAAIVAEDIDDIGEVEVLVSLLRKAASSEEQAGRALLAQGEHHP